MSEKDEALEHLSAIKSALVDKDTFFPYNFNAFIVWGVIGMIMTLFMGYILKSSILGGIIFSLFMMSVGFIIESRLTKKENENYDIESCTKKQRFIAGMFTFLTLFATFFSALLASYDLIIPAYIIWIFVIGIGDFAVGFVLNQSIFTKTALLDISAAVVLTLMTFFISDLGDLNSIFFYFVQGVTFALLGILPIMIAYKMKRLCSV